jgi:hypothetical protein
MNVLGESLSTLGRTPHIITPSGRIAVTNRCQNRESLSRYCVSPSLEPFSCSYPPIFSKYKKTKELYKNTLNRKLEKSAWTRGGSESIRFLTAIRDALFDPLADPGSKPRLPPGFLPGSDYTFGPYIVEKACKPTLTVVNWPQTVVFVPQKPLCLKPSIRH